MSRKRLAALVLAGIATTLAGGIASAADSNVTTLDEVVINSDRYNDSSVLPGERQTGRFIQEFTIIPM